MAEVLDQGLTEKLHELEQRSQSLSDALSEPGITADRERFASTSRAYAELQPIIEKFREYTKLERDLLGARELLDSADDPEMRGMAADEVKTLEADRGRIERELRLLLLPSDPNDEKNVVLEVRAGTGGDEATLFAREIFRMYEMFAEAQGWKLRTTDHSESSVGGFKEVIAIVEGDRVYSLLKFESGVHRVQRVPKTESQGRVHTSAVTVAVMPEAEEVEVELDDDELRIDTFCSSGPGGQSVNTTQSAVRITHLPTNIVVQCQDEKSWHKNKARALQVLRSRLYAKMLQDQHDEIASQRRVMVGSGDRSEKIRTYNFPQNRVTDHRIGLTTHNLDGVLNGELTPILEALASHDEAERLKSEVKA